MAQTPFTICIHGGAGVIGRDQPAERVQAYKQGLSDALKAGRAILESGGSALDAVVAAVRSMEENPVFNAGKGAVYNAKGGHELDAALMDGQSLACGAVAGVTTIRSPILAARRVMEASPHVLLTGPGADEWAAQQGLETVSNDWFDDPYRYKQWQTAQEQGRIQLDHAPDSASDGAPDPVPSSAQGAAIDEAPKGTVGAVALDSSGNLAAATSTGGMTNKKYGRVGDSPLIGAGTYANNQSCAVSCTGTGEQFIRHVVAHGIHARMLWGGQTLEQAAGELVHTVLKPGDGGLIAVDAQGAWTLPYNSAGMFRGVATGQGEFRVAIWEDWL